MVLQEEVFFPYFQPIVDVCTGQIAGYESLARYRNRHGQVVSAGWIFGDPEINQRQIVEIDRVVREKALNVFARDSRSELIFINVSPERIKLLGKNEIPNSIRLIRELGIDPSRVVIEVTEKFGDIALLDKMVKTYRDEGLQIAIDDFGVGGSQVDRLIKYSPDFLKIDMEIFKLASKGGAAANVLLSLADLADRSNCEILCEGVETEEEYHFAIECGASKIQGWLFEPALPKFIDRDSLADKVFSYQNSYLTRKQNRVLQANHRCEKIQSALDTIKRCYRENRINNIDVPFITDAGVIRFFVCDFNGNQISPNFEVDPKGVIENKRCEGRNWSHRPYFALLLALLDTADSREIVSKAYFDKNHQVLCKTRGFVLDGERILFVDTSVVDETLFCHNGLQVAENF